MVASKLNFLAQVKNADSPNIFVIAYVNLGSELSLIQSGTDSLVGTGTSNVSVVPE